MSMIKSAYKKTKNTVLQIPEIEKRVKEATSNEKWGPTSTQMRDISQCSHSVHDLPVVLSVLWRRLNDHGKNWRHVYKSLLLIDYLLRNGSEQVIRECRANVIQIQTLMEFQHIDEDDKDVGLSVRERARAISELLHDENRLRAERDKAKANAKKYLTGIGSDTPSWYTDSKDYAAEGGASKPRKEVHSRTPPPESDEEEEEEEEPAKPAQSTRPRAPSFEQQQPKVAAAPTVKTAIPQDLFDFTAPPQQTTSATSRQPVQQTPPNDLFASPPQQGFQDFFSQPPQHFQQTQPSNFDSFDPRGNSARRDVDPFTAETNTKWAQFGGGASVAFNDPFENSSKPNTSQPGGADKVSSFTHQEQVKETNEDPADPWNKKHLFDLDLKNPQSKDPYASQNRVPMGQVPKPMGIGKTSVPPTKASQPAFGVQPQQFNMQGQPMMGIHATQGMQQRPMMGGMQQPMMGGMQQPMMMGGMQQPMMMGGMQQPMMGGMQPMMGGMQQPMMGGMQQPGSMQYGLQSTNGTRAPASSNGTNNSWL